MFNIDLKPQFTVPVPAVAPDGSAQDFTATFEALEIDEFARFDLNTGAGTKALLDRVLVAVGDIVDSLGEPVPDSAELRARLVNRTWARSPLVGAYLEGLSKAKAGN